MDNIEETTSVAHEAASSEKSTPSNEAATTSQTDSGAGGEAGSNETIPAPAYVPDFKLKVYDEEKEIDPMFRGLIKDQDTEKKVKEFAQKAIAFDTVKTRHEKTKSDFQNYYQQSQPAVEAYQTYQQLAQKKDIGGIIEFLGIPDDEIFKYAVKKAQEAQLPDDQRQQIQMQRQIQKERELLATQNQSLQQQQFNQLAQFRAQELQWVMGRPDVSGVAQAFDTKNGSGAFRQMVIDKGLAHYAATGQDLPADKAVEEVMRMIGAFVQPTSVNGNQATPQAQLIQQNGGQPPIIPNVAGKATSPVKKQVRSIADLKKLGQERAGME